MTTKAYSIALKDARVKRARRTKWLKKEKERQELIAQGKVKQAKKAKYRTNTNNLLGEIRRKTGVFVQKRNLTSILPI